MNITSCDIVNNYLNENSSLQKCALSVSLLLFPSLQVIQSTTEKKYPHFHCLLCNAVMKYYSPEMYKMCSSISTDWTGVFL